MADRFSLKGETFAAAGDALFLVTENPARPGAVTGLFLPLSDRAGAAAAPKITHYGRYGYLVFHNGDNRLKGQFPGHYRSTTVVFAGAPAR